MEKNNNTEPEDIARLSSFRKKIDDIDNRILELLNQRAELAHEIGIIKKQDRTRVHVLEREESIYTRLMEKNRGPFPSKSIRPIFREIISASLSLEKSLDVAFLGPEATFSHVAAIHRFGQAAVFIPTRGVADIFDEVDRDRADYGVVPIENSTEGVVNLTLDMFIESPLNICAEVMLEISQCLLSFAEKTEDIKVVYSHQQALAQCYNWLSKNIPDAQIKETFSTAAAAQMAKKDHSSAAIASDFAARLYEIPVLKQKIEDNTNNFTRFWVIGKKTPGRTGNDKTSLMFSIKDGVGALHTILQPFAKHEINMTKIESRPFRKKPWEYIFFIDIEGHREEENVEKTLNEVSLLSPFLKVLGSYPKGNFLK